MKKTFNKALFLGAISLLSSNLLADETICYKNGLDLPSQIETSKLDGGICEGKLTLNDMKKSGWDILDIQVTTSQNKLSYSYYFYKNTNQSLSNTPKTYANSLNYSKKEFSIKPIGAKVVNLKDNQSTIEIGNLTVGQSGIVVHIYDNDKRLIVANAKVISSTPTSSVVEYFPFDDLKQDAIPTTKRVVTNNDVIVLNYMYNQSLLIAPDYDSFQAVRSDFKQNNFIHSDIFGTKLKVNNQPFPTKEDIQKFAIEQNLGTIFFVLDSKVYILDTKTFAILDVYSFPVNIKEKQMPFYTRVEEIKGPLIDFSSIPFFSDKEDLGYDDYYKQILGLK
ncbi:plasminogen-binding N-terminal domain-containing protein [Aliarcobacter butzleri]|uniref:plasminogen-binding N-terminal domain-containing protein n=1 Tax=Aliarcobacter butzleri TaxID=28197 RepID=UPI003AFB5746